ncbi:metallophosphoesterase [Myxococcus sp. K15C18031901]|uniref:metallophosphoesterase n=1 Tax=Myxococcus dinghuensis TaxID=2906761 RepID=UPI0020A7284B|nr:metallophosphoesterase [Myxococcus dinghuensis]MCP3103645.1 metallophosphoesterase [Myxococcus dinghuensis]
MSPLPEERYFAAVGDVHGHMDRMVRELQAWTRHARRELAFVLQVGDFEPHRSEADLATMSAPARYKQLGDFAAYHQQRRRFPWPVYFIGGNHEPYGYLDTAPEGFELTTNCHYLGRVRALDLGGVRVVGLSGIHDEAAFTRRRPPLSRLGSVSNRDFTFFTEEDVERAMEAGSADVLLLHDWPSGVIAAKDGAAFQGRRRSPSPEDVGNPYARLLVDALRPRLVLCGHLHRPYRGWVEHAEDVRSRVCCLSSVEEGPGAFAVFRVTGKLLQEVTWMGVPDP